MSLQGLVRLDGEFEKACSWLLNEITTHKGMVVGFDATAILEKAKERFAQEVLTYFQNSHTRPLRRAIGMLSVGELSELAETLVELESIKERVTRPSDSVGGPIDVAVISKSDGFIWIKRKHYFDPQLNSRYFARRDGNGKA
jgi:hypothetical protein